MGFFPKYFARLCACHVCSKLGEAEENQEHLKHKGQPSPPPGPAAPRVVLEQGSIPQTPRVPALTFGFISERKQNLAEHICPLISSLTTKPRQLLRAPARGKRSALPAALSGGSALKARIKNSPAAPSAELRRRPASQTLPQHSTETTEEAAVPPASSPNNSYEI